MRISNLLLMAALMFGANAASAQSTSVSASQYSLINQTVSSLFAGEINGNKNLGGRRFRCPEFCS